MTLNLLYAFQRNQPGSSTPLRNLSNTTYLSFFSSVIYQLLNKNHSHASGFPHCHENFSDHFSLLTFLCFSHPHGLLPHDGWTNAMLPDTFLTCIQWFLYDLWGPSSRQSLFSEGLDFLHRLYLRTYHPWQLWKQQSPVIITDFLHSMAKSWHHLYLWHSPITSILIYYSYLNNFIKLVDDPPNYLPTFGHQAPFLDQDLKSQEETTFAHYHAQDATSFYVTSLPLTWLIIATSSPCLLPPSFCPHPTSLPTSSVHQQCPPQIHPASHQTSTNISTTTFTSHRSTERDKPTATPFSTIRCLLTSPHLNSSPPSWVSCVPTLQFMTLPQAHQVSLFAYLSIFLSGSVKHTRDFHYYSCIYDLSRDQSVDPALLS